MSFSIFNFPLPNSHQDKFYTPITFLRILTSTSKRKKNGFTTPTGPKEFEIILRMEIHFVKCLRYIAVPSSLDGCRCKILPRELSSANVKPLYSKTAVTSTTRGLIRAHTGGGGDRSVICQIGRRRARCVLDL